MAKQAADKTTDKPSGKRLKVFRTVAGFHDAYVAAPSRKAALAAWGTTKDLFARGAAEQVTDPALMAQPLADPGTVFRQLRAMPADEPAPTPPRQQAGTAARPPRAAAPVPKMRTRPVKPPSPRPTRDEVENATAALAKTRAQHAREEQALAARERDLARERQAQETRQTGELQRLTTALESANQAYETRLEAWRQATVRPRAG